MRNNNYYLDKYKIEVVSAEDDFSTDTSVENGKEKQVNQSKLYLRPKLPLKKHTAMLDYYSYQIEFMQVNFDMPQISPLDFFCTFYNTGLDIIIRPKSNSYLGMFTLIKFNIILIFLTNFFNFNWVINLVIRILKQSSLVYLLHLIKKKVYEKNVNLKFTSKDGRVTARKLMRGKESWVMEGVQRLNRHSTPWQTKLSLINDKNQERIVAFTIPTDLSYHSIQLKCNRFIAEVTRNRKM